jgi:anaerobic magnesium-protoporphyrin IX monomethyl ester cyclase
MSTKSAKCLLIMPKPRFEFIDPVLGLLYLEAAAKEWAPDWEFRIADARFVDPFSVLEEFSPDVVGVSVTMPLTPAAINMAKCIRLKRPNVLLIAGGPQATATPHIFLAHFDIVVLGEAEEAFAHILNRISEGVKPTTSAALTRNDCDFHKMHPGRIADLDSLPFPHIKDMSVFSRYRFRGTRMYPIITSRGCPFGCIYCDKAVSGYSVRRRSPRNVVAEMEEAHSEHGISLFQIRDDTFTLDGHWIEDFSGVLCTNGKNFRWTCNTRADLITRNLATRLRDAGCIRVSFGAEAGDDSVLLALGKRITVDRTIEAARICHEAGLSIKFYLMVGAPHQDMRSVGETVKLLRVARPEEIYCSVFMPTPGSVAWSQLSILGVKFLFNKDDPYQWANAYYQSNLHFEEAPPAIQTDWLSKDQIIDARHRIFEAYQSYCSKR